MSERQTHARQQAAAAACRAFALRVLTASKSQPCRCNPNRPAFAAADFAAQAARLKKESQKSYQDAVKKSPAPPPAEPEVRGKQRSRLAGQHALRARQQRSASARLPLTNCCCCCCLASLCCTWQTSFEAPSFGGFSFSKPAEAPAPAAPAPAPKPAPAAPAPAPSSSFSRVSAAQLPLALRFAAAPAHLSCRLAVAAACRACASACRTQARRASPGARASERSTRAASLVSLWYRTRAC